jgi:hypothetical protein
MWLIPLLRIIGAEDAHSNAPKKKAPKNEGPDKKIPKKSEPKNPTKSGYPLPCVCGVLRRCYEAPFQYRLA